MAFHRYFVLEEEKEKHIENAHPRPTVQSFKFKGEGDVLWGWASYEYHDHLAITNSTVFAKYWYMYLELP